MIRVEKTHLPVAALTHPGMKGKNNEDRFGVSAFRMNSRSGTPVLLGVLSDGIGGHRAGEVASELAVNVISQYAANSDGRQPTQTLGEAIRFASQAIFEQAQKIVEQQGMGATCACAWIAGDQLYTATVGDSRVYLMRAGSIYQLSTDHTWIQEALEHGLLQADEVNGHPNAHVIRRYLGSPTPPEVDFRMRPLEPGNSAEAVQGMRLLPDDCLLLCSDGLTDLVEDEEILAAFRKETLETAGQQLVSLANERGGHDNITLIAIQIPPVQDGSVAAAVPEVEAAAAAATARRWPRRLLVGCLAVVLLAMLVGGITGGWILYAGRGGQPSPTTTATLLSTLLLPSPERTVQPTRTRTATLTSTPFAPAESTRTQRPFVPGAAAPSLTPWRANTPTPQLPIVTVAP